MIFALHVHRRHRPFTRDLDHDVTLRARAADDLYDNDDEYRELSIALHQIQNAKNNGAKTLEDAIALMERRQSDLIDDWIAEK